MTECGAGFTQNLEQMFKDVELSREEMSAYKTLMSERNEKSTLDLSVNVLSASAWPTYNDIPVIIPHDIQRTIDRFGTYYKSKHSGRKLDWKHALAHCQVRADFPKGKKELVVSSFQAIVLLLFNGKSLEDQISYEDIRAATGLRKSLQNLLFLCVY
jgi:cullin 4